MSVAGSISEAGICLTAQDALSGDERHRNAPIDETGVLVHGQRNALKANHIVST